MRPGLYLLHKPVGPTSAEVMREAAGGTGRAVCHGGALDPFAEGLLIVLAGPATRLFELLHPVPKEYEGTVAWGTETDTGDPGGATVASGDPASLTPAALDEALQGFLGFTGQLPPATSNKRVGGERAYVRARRGEAVVLPPSQVYLHGARFVSHDLPRSSRLRLVCRGGFYVRSLVRDLGRRVRVPAHLSSLHRSAIGPWHDPGPGGRVGVHGKQLLPWLPSRELSDAEARSLRRGPIPVGTLLPPLWPLPPGFPGDEGVVLGHRSGSLAAVLRLEGSKLTRLIELGAGI